MESDKYLSKHKWIGRITRTDEGEFAIERFPIIYISKDLIYYKVPGSRDLAEFRGSFSDIANSPEECLPNEPLYSEYKYLYFWADDKRYFDKQIRKCSIRATELARTLKIQKIEKEIYTLEYAIEDWNRLKVQLDAKIETNETKIGVLKKRIDDIIKASQEEKNAHGID